MARAKPRAAAKDSVKWEEERWKEAAWFCEGGCGGRFEGSFEDFDLRARKRVVVFLYQLINMSLATVWEATPGRIRIANCAAIERSAGPLTKRSGREATSTEHMYVKAVIVAINTRCGECFEKAKRDRKGDRVVDVPRRNGARSNIELQSVNG